MDTGRANYCTWKMALMANLKGSAPAESTPANGPVALYRTDNLFVKQSAHQKQEERGVDCAGAGNAASVTGYDEQELECSCKNCSSVARFEQALEL